MNSSVRALRLLMYLDDGLKCGGAERVAGRLLAHWSERGLEIYLAARQSADAGFYALPSGVKGLSLKERSNKQSGRGDQPSQSTGLVSHWLRIIPGRSLLRLAYEAFLLRRLLRRTDVDVVVAFLTPANVKVLLAAYGLRCKVVISERNDTRAYRYPFMWEALRRLLYRHADVVTANLAASIEDMARYVPVRRLAFVPNPVTFPGDGMLAAPDRSRRIVSVGRLVSYKRQLLLIDAFASLGEEFNDWELDIVGEGPMRPDLERAIAGNGLTGRVHLHGVSHDVESYYRLGAIFVLPSRVEGTPNVLLEAMAHALPSVVSDSIAGAMDYVEEGVTGFAFSSESSADLARRIASLASSPELRKQMGGAARNQLMNAASTGAYDAWDGVIGVAVDSPQIVHP